MFCSAHYVSCMPSRLKRLMYFTECLVHIVCFLVLVLGFHNKFFEVSIVKVKSKALALIVSS